MTREQLIRWCAIREKAVDALHEAHRHVFDMATLALGDDPVMHALASTGTALDEAFRSMTMAKVVALGTMKEAA